MLGVIIASKCKVLIVLGECREILEEKWLAGWDVYSADCSSLSLVCDIYCCDFKHCKVWYICFDVMN
jgi:hypothetical protein